MSKEILYHFFPRKDQDVDAALRICESFFQNGIYLTREVIDVNWPDYYGKNRERKLKIEQFRFCLTAITSDTELQAHSIKFGFLGIEFDSDFIVQIGGFPVFYVPSPQVQSNHIEDYKGISLLYRIAEIQEILEYVSNDRRLFSDDIDIDNAVGAVRLLANICYPTHRNALAHTKSASYYNQREWRVIHGMASVSSATEQRENFYIIRSHCGKETYKFIKKVVVSLHNSTLLKQRSYIEQSLLAMFTKYNVDIPIHFV